MSRKSPAISTWLYMGLVAFLGAFAGFRVSQGSKAALKTIESSVSMQPQERSLTQDEILETSMLIDSIISIVQSYYVDESRVVNRSLVVLLARALGDSSPLEVSVADDQIKIAGKEFSKTVSTEFSDSYQGLVDVFLKVSSFVDSFGIPIAETAGMTASMRPSTRLFNHVLAGLDAHSALLSPEAYKELRQGTEGSFGGLGVLVGIRDSLLTVIKPLPRSPAKRAGIRKSDKILDINGVMTYGSSLDDLVEHMRGDPGTEVQISLLRSDSTHPLSMSLKREVIQVDSVVSHPVESEAAILHLSIETFSSRTAREVLSSIKRFRMRNNGRLDGLILDLRSNPGGLLDQAVQVVDLFVPDGVIVSTRGRRQEVESAGSGFDEIGFPMAVLIDGDSASASEIVAGALQDHGRAVVVGQPSFGKGSVQTIFELPGQSAIKLTIARYYTPHGRSIQNVGIVPDLWLQPVVDLESNKNLLGAYRYKNERFLRHHLLSDRPGSHPTASTLRSYYLAPVDGEEQPVEDVELIAAKTIVTENTANNVSGKDRASHWLAVAGPKLMSYLGRKQDNVAKTLRSRFGVTWGEDVGGGSVQMNLADRVFVAKPGDTLDIPWSLTNSGSRAARRISIFVRSEGDSLETVENLVGQIPGGETRSGVLKLEIPTFWEPGTIKLRVGMAVDAWPSDLAEAATLQIVDREIAELVAEFNLVDGQQSRMVGFLEPGEDGEIQISIENTGPTPAHDVAVYIDNLSGKQIAVDPHVASVKKIGAGENISFSVPIRGKDLLFTKEMGLGLRVESRDLGMPFTKRFAIKAAVNTSMQALGH